MAFSQAVSGLNAAATNLDVIGNNIANSATYGFKSGTASFADMFAGSKVGLGVKVAGLPRTLPTAPPPVPDARWTWRLARTVFSVWSTATVPFTTAVTASSSLMRTAIWSTCRAERHRLSGNR